TLRGARQLAVEQKVSRLREAPMVGKLIDGIAAIEQDALVAVDESDFGLAARRRGVAGVVGEAAGLLVEGVDVEDIGSERALADGQVVARTVDRYGRRGRVRPAKIFCHAHLMAPLTRDRPPAGSAPAGGFLHCHIIAPIVSQRNNRAAQILSRATCMHLIPKPGKGFLAPEHLKNVENTRGSRASG